MMRLIVLGGLLLTSNVLAEEQNVLGWTRDGASLVYKTADDTGTEEEGGYSGQAQLAVVVDAKSGQLKQYLLELSDATPEEKKRYRALPGKDAFATWLKANPVDCASGRKSPDGKARADIKVRSKDFEGSWSGKEYDISPKNIEDGFVTEAFEAVLSVSRDGKTWPKGTFGGRIAFHGGALGSEVSLCWAPEGMRVALIVHTGRTMRDPEVNDLRMSSATEEAFDPEGTRTAAMRAAINARRANVAGMKAYRAKNYVVATKKFREAIAADASFVTAHYNLACVAALQGDKKSALAELKWLSASSDPEAKAKLKKAPTDPDLRALAGDPDAKALLGEPAQSAQPSGAGQIRHPAGFVFDLPATSAPWSQEQRGDVMVVEDENGKLPELQMFFFPVKREGPLADIVARIAAEIVRPGVQPEASDPIKSAKLIGAVTPEAIADASLVSGKLTVDGQDAAFAVVQRGGRSLIALALPKDGIYERGVANFRRVLGSLKPRPR
jgi:hypothetical protein